MRLVGMVDDGTRLSAATSLTPAAVWVIEGLVSFEGNRPGAIAFTQIEHNMQTLQCEET
jgi:hypothetical protein